MHGQRSSNGQGTQIREIKDPTMKPEEGIGWKLIPSVKKSKDNLGRENP